MAVSVVLPRRSRPMRTESGPCSSTRRAPRCARRWARSAARWPALVDRVLTEQGELRRHVNIFVGDESIAFLDGLSTAIDEGTTITIVPAVSGG